eukprot:762787-Hanusia_phi.AAC.2
MKQNYGAMLDIKFVGWKEGGWRKISQESKGRRRWHEMEDAAKKIENGGADSVEMLVTVLSEESREQLLNELMKKKGDSQDEAFEMEAAKIKMSDFKHLDANADGVRFDRVGETHDSITPAPVEEPNMQQLWLVGTASAVPFIGFGFMDNAIMILAGEIIEVKIGAIFSISTMAAAAIGNLISDVAGVGMGSYVEKVARKIGFKEPNLSSEQVIV